LLDKLFHILYDTIIITIIKKPHQIYIFTEFFYKGKSKKSYEKEFILNDSYKPYLLENYLKDFFNESPYCYISLLDTTTEQGAIPTCKKQEMEKFHNLVTSKYICIDDKWACYTSKLELEKQKKLTGEEIEVDFIFSPFLILSNFFEDKIKGIIALYAFLQEESVTIAVFRDSQLLFGQYIDLNTLVEDELLLENINENETSEDTDNVDIDAIDLDEIDIDDDFGDLDSFDDEIADLDTLDDINSLENEDSLEQQLDDNLEELNDNNAEEEESEEDEENKEEKLTMDFQFFSIIQKSLGTYYRNDQYQSDFVENIYVADSVGVTREFKKYVEEEMFLNVYVRTIETELELVNLTKKELEKL